jgi:protocatechuate 3,4-dioxygenase beta subunit
MSLERTHDAHGEEVHDHDRGLSFDVSTLMTRRGALQLLAVGGLAALVGCGSSSSDPAGAASSASPPGSTASTATAAGGATAEIPEETAGPFPADGSNGVNVLAESGIVRGDITSSFGSASGAAEGVPLSIELTILDVSTGGTPLEGAAVYLWHCDRDGRYSLYDAEIPDENYLRGVQASGADGRVAFTSIWPGAYPGRWPHIHFEVYPSLDEATAAGAKLVTSQIALPEDPCALVYATAGYEQSAQNMARTSLATDSVFSDGYSTQLGTASGSPGEGMTVRLNVGV